MRSLCCNPAQVSLELSQVLKMLTGQICRKLSWWAFMASASAAVRKEVCGGSLVVSFTCVSLVERRIRSVRWGRHGSARAAEKVGGWVFRRAGTTF